ncbi:MAG: peptide chain release factor N(5)-glutamine methyltransferase [Clostridiaceae bacterium]|nr:peptide chain release factor N(5)-glutamine methyltransferase [Clostridiaceae bacterium]
MVITVREILQEAVQKFKAADIDTPQLDAEVILCHLLKLDRIKLHIYPEMEISREICQRYWENVEKRLNHMPVQYITKQQEFMGLDLLVEEGVLIPRGDTEVLVEKVIDLYNQHYAPGEIKLMDIGTGSGAIAVSLGHYIKDSQIYAIDISPKALEVAEKNRNYHELQDKITLLEGSLFAPLEGKDLKGTFDFIVSNPPYIPPEVVETLASNVKDYEPRLALEGGEDGLYFYREIVKLAPGFLKPEGWLAFEIGYDQGKTVQQLMKEAGFAAVEVIKDLAGLDRVVIGKKKI